jgi:cyclophilin family peptidyl-prolyl cis-trans isomerase
MGTTKRERQKTLRQARLEAAHAAQKRYDRRRRLLMVLGIVAVVAVLGFGINAVFLGDDDSGEDAAAADDTTTTVAEGQPPTPEPPGPGATIEGETPCPEIGGAEEERTTTFAAAPPMCIDPAKTYTATFVTNRGDIPVTLDAATVPGAVNNFVVLAEYGYYDGTAIFRTDPSIGIIQGGGPTTNTPGDQGPGYTIPDEGGPFTYGPGQLVMARSAGENSTGAQYFFVVNESAAALDAQGTYLVIGQTDDAGLSVIQQVLDLHVPREGDTLGGGPLEEVIVEDVVIEES